MLSLPRRNNEEYAEGGPQSDFASLRGQVKRRARFEPAIANRATPRDACVVHHASILQTPCCQLGVLSRRCLTLQSGGQFIPSACLVLLDVAVGLLVSDLVRRIYSFGAMAVRF